MLKYLDVIAAVLLVIGGLNWGLVGVANFNLVDFLFGGTFIDTLVYSLVGLSAIWQIFNIKGIQCRWGGGSGGSCCK
jgi:uncharacterized protein